MKIALASADDADEWAAMRAALWPEMCVEDHRSELAELYLNSNPNRIAFLARGDDGNVVGFAEVSLRHDFVNGCETSPALFLEGIFVRPPFRNKASLKRSASQLQNGAAPQAARNSPPTPISLMREVMRFTAP
jgi:aminoglycoside 6'-N-acetyltransferase I